MISNNIKPYLDDIAEKLWTGHASVMVGAGFSKNASSKFPDWNQLGDIFYEKIKGVKPEPSNVQYANVLKMADSVDAAFGRPELNKILKEAIPDISVSPSKVHIDLVTLPWAEVFTTNYDSLLERAAEQVTTRRYDIVKRQDDLVFSKSPRILKLHGCFSSSSDLIISEEDYRTYPARYAPFVNTVQQALLETALCLIGFSGDDPNFLKWVGWIRDNLGRENSAPIYLIGYFSMSEAEKRLLEKRNIVVVDMSLCEDINDHAKATQAFITHLKSKQEAKNATKWPHKIQMSQYSPAHDSKEQLSSFVKSVSNLKSTYPGWVIAPHSVREKLSHLSNGWYQFNKLEMEDSNAKLDYFYYCCWLSKLCLTPIFDDFAKRLEDYLNSINGNIGNLCLSKLSVIALTLARYYREEFLWDSWEKWLVFCDGLSESLSIDDTQHIQLERLYALLYKNNISTLCQNLATWRVEQKSYGLRLKKAAILAELGEIKGALEEAKAVLQNVRKQLNLSPESGDYFLRSVESYAMLLIRIVDGADDFSSRNRNEEFSERWELLKSTLCDPWGEFEFFDARLEAKYFPPQSESKKPSFDIGTYQTSYSMGADTYAMHAMALFRFYEEAGLPIKVKHTVINAKTVKNAAFGTVNYFPQWTLHYLLRLGDVKNIKDVWNRKALIGAPKKGIENISSLLLNLFEEIEDKLSVSNNRSQNNLYDRYATVVPELLSMLISRMSFKQIYRAYNIATALYRSEKYKRFDGVDLLIKRALKVTSKEQQGDLAKLAVMCSCPKSIYSYNENKLEPPIWSFDNKIISDLVLDDKLIEKSIELMHDSLIHRKRWGFFTLIKFYNAKILSHKQMSKFTNAIWHKVPKDDIPNYPGILKSAYLYLPHSIEKDQLSFLVKSKVLDLDIPVKGDSTSYTVTSGHIPFIEELLNSHKDIELTDSDILELLEKLVSWWDADKENLNDDKDPRLFGSPADEFRARFANLVSILELIVIPRLNKQESVDPNILNKLSQLIQELDDYKFGTIKSKLACKKLLDISEEKIIDSIINMLLSRDEKLILEAVNSLIYWQQIVADYAPQKITSLLGVLALTRTEKGLVHILSALHYIQKNSSESLTEEVIGHFVSCLEKLYLESKLDSDYTEELIAEKLYLRQKASEMSKEIMESKMVSNELKSQLAVWSNTANDDSEFNEIKRGWS